jgi:hypothetical protein
LVVASIPALGAGIRHAAPPPGNPAESASTVAVTAGAPTITSFSPGSASAPGTWIYIVGTNLDGGTVAFNGVVSSRFDSYATYGYAMLPAGATTGRITVTTTSGTATSATDFVVSGTVQAPTLTSLSPTSGLVGSSMVITGTNFTGASAVKFNGVSATAFTVNSATQITVTVPAGATTGAVSVITPGGTASGPSFTVTAAAPTVSSLSPTNGLVGSSVVITGTNFTGASAVKFNGVSATAFTVNSATQITVTVPAGATTGAVSVTTPGGTANGPSFTVTVPAAPTVSSLSPTSGLVGSSVVITGTNLTGASAVKFNGIAATAFTVNSATQITVTVPAGATTGVVSVTTSAGTANGPSFTVTPAGNLPVITSFSPTTATAYNTWILINGQNLVGATISFNGVVSTRFDAWTNGTGGYALLPVGATTGKVTATTAAGTTTSVDSLTITAVPSAPTLSSLSPTSGKVGDTVTLTGSNFTGASAVKFGGVAATYSVVSDTQITAVVPSGAISGAVSVTTGGGTVTGPTFTMNVTGAPTVTTLSPTSGAVGSSVILTGTNLTAATTVTFGGVVAPAFTVNSATQITVTVPAGAASGAVNVTTPGGTATGPSFTVTVAAPTVSSLSPNTGLVGSSVVITGTNLLGASAVKFNGISATAVTVNSATQITATVPSGAITGAVSVTTPGGTVSGPTFTVNVAPPTVSSLSPTSGLVGSSVVITGTNLLGATSVSFGSAAAAFTVNSATQITATVPASAITGLVSVSTPGGTANGLTFTVTSPVVAPAITAQPQSLTVIEGATATFNVTATGTAPSYQWMKNGVDIPGATSSSLVFTAALADGGKGFSVRVTNTAGGVTSTSATLTVQANTGAITLDFLVNGGFEQGYDLGWVANPSTFIPNVWFYDVTTDPVLFSRGSHSGKWIGYLGGAETNERFIGQDVLIPAGATRANFSFWYLGESAVADAQDTFAAEVVDPVSGTVLQTLESSNGSLANGNWKNVTVDLKAYAGQKIRLRFHAIRVDSNPGNPNRTAWSIDDTSLMVDSSAAALTPAAASFSPAKGVMGSAPITITGQNFVGATEVQFGGVKTTNFKIVDAQTIIATVPSGALTGAITVKTPYGNAVTAGSFQVLTADLLVNGNFEGFRTGWNASTYVPQQNLRIQDVTIATTLTIPTHSGNCYGLMGTGSVANQTLAQDVTIPTGTTVAELGFWLRMDASTTGTDAADTFTAAVENPTTGAVLKTLQSFNGTNGPVGAWAYYTGDMSQFAGQTVRVVFRAISNATTEWTNWYLDDCVLGVNSSMASVQGVITGYAFNGTATTQALETTDVQIKGSNFYGVSGVLFNGIAADPKSIVVLDPGTIRVTVPGGALSGAVTVQTNRGDVIGTSLTVLAKATDLLVNGYFDLGKSGWTPTSRIGDTSGSGTWTMTPQSGKIYGYLGGEATAVTTLDQDVTIPVDIRSAILTYYMSAETAETATGKDIFSAQIVDGTTTTTLMSEDAKAYTSTTLWRKYSYDLSAYKGKTIKIRFRASNTDSTASVNDWSVFYVDSASLVCDTTNAPALMPTLTSFTPGSGFPNETVVTLTGTKFYGASAVKFGGVPATTWAAMDAQTIQATVPQGAKPGTIAVETNHGNVTSAGSFTITYHAPTSSNMDPTQGPVGTKIIINGNFLDATTGVTVGGLAATYTVDGLNQITITVPAGATTGAVIVTNPGGSTNVGTFTVNTASTTTDFWIDNVTISQATQTANTTVAMIKDRRALVRVFVRANQINTQSPQVKVTVMNGGNVAYTTLVNGPTSGVPLVANEFDTATTWNAMIPASAVQAGMSLLVELDPNHAVPQADPTNDRWPISGTYALTVKDTKPFKVSLLPMQVTYLGKVYTANVTTADIPSYMKMFQRVWPLPEAIDTQIHATFVTQQVPMDDYTNWYSIVGELLAAQKAEAPNRYFYGVYNSYYGSGGGTGMAYASPSTAAMGIMADTLDTRSPGFFTYRSGTVAHELGHALSRPHTPCGGAGSPDTAYPYTAGSIGVTGTDVFATGSELTIYNPKTYADIMAYCGYGWVSDYCYNKVMDFRLSGSDTTLTGVPGPVGSSPAAGQVAIAAESEPEDCLLVWGMVKNGVVTLNPGFIVKTHPDVAEADASFHLDLTDAAGVVLDQVAFEPNEAPHNPLPERSFSVAVSLRKLKALQKAQTLKAGGQDDTAEPLSILDGVRVHRRGETLAHHNRNKGAHRGLAAKSIRAPQALRVNGETVRLTWDVNQHPMAMVRNEKGEVIAFAKGGSIDLPTEATFLDVQFSDTLTSVGQRIHVK